MHAGVNANGPRAANAGRCDKRANDLHASHASEAANASHAYGPQRALDEARSNPVATLKPGKRSEPGDARDCDRALASQKNLGCRHNACVNERQDRMKTNPFAGNAMLVDGVNRKSGLCCELCGIAVFGELADPCSNLL